MVNWVELARVLYTETRSLAEREFIEAERAIGAGRARILFRHILPHLVSTILVYGTLGIATTVLLEATLSFLGVGVQPPTPSWGNIINENQTYFTTARRDRHQGRDQVARPGQRHRRRRHRKDRADDLVGRHGLDRRLPRSCPTSTARSSAPAEQSRKAWNWSWYYDKKDREAEAAKADAMVKPEEGAKPAPSCGGSIFIKIMEDDAPWAPVFHEEHYTIPLGADRRVELRDLINDPVHTPTNFNGLYATDVKIGRRTPSTAGTTTSGGIMRSRPSITVAPGTTIEFEVVDAGGNNCSPRRAPSPTSPGSTSPR